MYDPIAAAQAIIPRLRETAAQSEAQRRVSDDAIAALKEAGLARLMAPRRYGGYELSPRAQILSCAITAQGSSAASWVQMVCGAHTFIVGRFPERCQDEVFAGGPDVLIPGTPAMQGTVQRVDGGWLLNGRWQFCSGVDHGPWLILGARGIDDQAGNKTPNLQVVVPKSDMLVDDTWFTLGMRGTGSKDIVAQDVFVPVHRALHLERTFLGTVEGGHGAVYRLPVPAVLASMAAGAVLGIAERGFQCFVAETRVRQDVYVGGSKAAKTSFQMRTGEAAGELDMARMLMEQSCDLLDEVIRANAIPMSLEARAKVRWNAAYAVELCRRATERVYAVAGAHATYDKSELQRFHRDINTACHHAIFDFDGIAEVRGRLMLGLDEGRAMV
ncbi:MAG: hypothetical protein ISP90_08755 [Nevskia sp.]|nr:hypothetical protein [Nevskia sp.]